MHGAVVGAVVPTEFGTRIGHDVEACRVDAIFARPEDSAMLRESVVDPPRDRGVRLLMEDEGMLGRLLVAVEEDRTLHAVELAFRRPQDVRHFAFIAVAGCVRDHPRLRPRRRARRRAQAPGRPH